MGFVSETAEAYHARKEISRGMLADFHQRRRLFEGRHVSRTIAPQKPSKSMETGTLVHAAILEPHRINDLYAPIPQEHLAINGAASTKAAKEFIAEAQANGRCPIKSDQFDAIRAMAASVNQVCGDWLNVAGVVEQTIVWQHPTTQLPCRCKPDWIRRTKTGKRFVFDLKTTGDLSERGFRASVEKFGYWLQDAHYCEGVTAATGDEVESFLFVAVESEPPYGCRVFEIDSESRAAAKESRERLMESLAECYRSNNWCDPWEGTVTKLSVRSFAFFTGEVE